MKIKISSTDQLIEFIKENDLSIQNYQSIIKTYSGTQFFLTYRAGRPEFTQKDRKNLVSLIESKAKNVDAGHPLFFSLGQ